MKVNPAQMSPSWRIGWMAFGAVAATLSIAFAWHQVERMLLSDPRFVITSTSDEDESKLYVSGVRHASAERVHAIFAKDAGRSVYMLPLAERRRNLLAVEWVKDARVSRIWPNQIAVQITERNPVAFAQLPRLQSTDAPLMLIDEDGVLLPLETSAKFRLPVVCGIRRDQTEMERRGRVRRLMKLSAEVGRHMERISEIDVSDPDNLKLTYPLDDRAMILHVGHSQFARRLRRFLDNLDEIRKKLPDARVLDLRLEDRITAVRDEAAGAEPVSREKKSDD